jgi:hypothetical protein
VPAGACSAIRTVIAIAERMPELGRTIDRLAAYLKAQCDAGVLAIDDCEIAAAVPRRLPVEPVLFGSASRPRMRGSRRSSAPPC